MEDKYRRIITGELGKVRTDSSRNDIILYYTSNARFASAPRLGIPPSPERQQYVKFVILELEKDLKSFELL